MSRAKTAQRADGMAPQPRLPVARTSQEHAAPGPGPDVGLRRVDWVRVIVTPSGVRYEAVGIGHRWPVTRPIPCAAARSLIAGGVRVVVRRVS